MELNIGQKYTLQTFYLYFRRTLCPAFIMYCLSLESISYTDRRKSCSILLIVFVLNFESKVLHNFIYSKSVSLIYLRMKKTRF
jgi:hypothetical protein